MRQLEYWNDYAGPRWARNAGGIEELNAPLGQRALDVAVPVPGERVLDIGCGTGATTLAIGRAVGSAGSVVGLDLSTPMITVARADPAAAELAWVEFRDDDIESVDLEPGSFDLAYSRMCLMLLDDPVRGLANVRRALRVGGRLVATAFRGMGESPWLPLVVMGTAPHVGPLPPLPLPGEPGPFAFADPDRPRALLTDAGFSEIEITPFDVTVAPELDQHDVADLLIELGPAGHAYAQATPADQAAARADVVGLLSGYADGNDRFRLPYGCWLITAVAATPPG